MAGLKHSSRLLRPESSRSLLQRSDLTDSDFSHADIHGTDFRNTRLAGANFSHARAGLPRYWSISLVVGSLLLSALSGLTSALSGAFPGYFLLPQVIEKYSPMPGLIVLLLFVAFFIVAIYQDLESAFGVMAAAIVAAGVVTIVRTGVGAGVFTKALAVAFFAAGIVAAVLAFVWADVAAQPVVTAVAMAGAIAGAGAFVMAGVVTGTVAFAVTVTVIAVEVDNSTARTRADSLKSRVSRRGNLAWVTIVGETAVGIFAVAFASILAGTIAGKFAVVAAGAVAILGVYIGWQALASKGKHALVQRMTIALAKTGGTSFRRANLTGANFAQATLSNTDFRRATLNHANWSEAQKLEQARFSGPRPELLQP